MEIRIRDGDDLRLGDTVAGEISWRPEEETRVKGLRVELLWRTEGRGDSDDAVVARFDGDIGETVGVTGITVPFSLTLPREGPMSYDGQIIRILWTVRARADIPWGIDVKAERNIHIGPAIATS